MYRGETINTVITGFPIPVSEIKSLYITFKKSREIVLEKTLDDCTISGESVSFRLSQEESLKLDQGTITRSAILISKDGARFESDSSPFVCRETSKDEVLE